MTDILELRHEADLISERRLDAIKTLSPDEKEAALLRFARLAMNDEFPTDALPGIIRRLAAPDVPDVMLRFTDLCDSLSEQDDFEGNPSSWLDQHDMPNRAYLEAHDRLAGQVAWAVRCILHGGLQ
jgi:hypothetical protein